MAVPAAVLSEKFHESCHETVVAVGIMNADETTYLPTECHGSPMEANEIT